MEALRRSHRFSSVPVVIATSSASTAERSRSELLGVERFLTKPFDLNGFLEMGLVVKELLLKTVERDHSTSTFS